MRQVCRRHPRVELAIIDLFKVRSDYKSIQNAKIEMSMPAEAVTIKVMGSIVWSKEVYDEQGRTVALGIRFEQMSPQLSGLLIVFANLLNTSSSHSAASGDIAAKPR
jgi:hypothetical protein